MLRSTISVFVLSFLLLLAGTAAAQCVPDPANSTCVLTIVDNDACPNTFPPNLVWCPAGDMSYFQIEVTLKDVTGAPCAFTDVRVSVDMSGQAAVAGNNIFGCGFDAVGHRDFSLTTDANGKAYAKFWGGGCGCLNIRYVATTVGFVICTGQADFCVKSPDLNGDGVVNFFDVFQYLPCLQSSYSICCDYNCDGVVNFFDTFQFLPHLNGNHNCVGSSLPYHACNASFQCF